MQELGHKKEQIDEQVNYEKKKLKDLLEEEVKK